MEAEALQTSSWCLKALGGKSVSARHTSSQGAVGVPFLRGFLKAHNTHNFTGTCSDSS